MESGENGHKSSHLESRPSSYVEPSSVADRTDGNGSETAAAQDPPSSSPHGLTYPHGEEAVMEVDTDSEFKRDGVPERKSFQATQETKLKELFRKINSAEIKLCLDATKEFIKLLKGDMGGKLLRLYVQTSPSLSELVEAWKLRQRKPGMSRVMSLTSALLGHPDGRNKSDDQERIGVSRVLDSFARLLVDENLDVVYYELKSKDGKRQNAALLLMASVVRRGSGLAYEVARRFDFRLQGFSKLAEYYKLKQHEKKKHSTRKSFVGFAMSFLEVGKPGLLRSILRQREMYSGVLRGLGNDDDETVIYVLSTLRSKVLIEESLVPPALRSVLFGSVTLEQLVNISGRENGPAVELAYNILAMVCIDPCNGLMPDLRRHSNPLKGNVKRLLGVMKKLKATESGYHKDLLLAILKGRPCLCAAYMNEFPYNIEDHASASWFSNVSLAADLVLSVSMGNPFDFIDVKSNIPPSFASTDVQSIINCMCPRSCSRSVINKGLLHSDFLVKHGTLRLLLESLTLLDSFIGFLNQKDLSSPMIQNWHFLKKEIQDEIPTFLPDVQVLLTVLSPLGSHSKIHDLSLKRRLEKKLSAQNTKSTKKLRKSITVVDTDIIVSGVSSTLDVALPTDGEMFTNVHMTAELGAEKEVLNMISELWSSDLCSRPLAKMKDAEMYFFSRLLDAFKIYLRVVPTTLEGSFDFFMNLLSDPLSLQADMQRSLLSFLIEYIGIFPTTRSRVLIRSSPMMYKHLQPFINLLIFSPDNGIKDQAYSLARAAMLSTGAFDRNPEEIGAWFLFLPGYGRNKPFVSVEGLEVLQSLSPVVISFLSDAISTVGNNLFKYWDIVRRYVSVLEGVHGMSPNFSPLVVCVLQKCLRLLSSESGTFSLSQKSLVSLYVCNTLKYLLQTQVHSGLLSSFIELVLSEGIGERNCLVYGSERFICEWKPLQNLLDFSQRLLHQQIYCFLSTDESAISADGSFARTLDELKKLVRSEHVGDLTGIVKAFCSAIVCTTPSALLENFPLVASISQIFQGVPVSLLTSIIFGEQNFIAAFSKCWPEVFFPSLKKALAVSHHEGKEGDDYAILDHSLFSVEMMCNVDFNAMLSATDAFSLFLKQAPFHVLFPALININIICSGEPSDIQDLLLAKLSDWTSDCFVSYVRLVLFWLHQIQLCYRTKPLAQLEHLSEMCSCLVKRMFSQLLALKLDCGSQMSTGVPLAEETLREVAETIFTHPAVMLILDHPLSCNEKLATGISRNSLDTFLCLFKQIFHPLDHHVLNVLTATLDYFSSLSGGHCYSLSEKGASKTILRSFSVLVQKVFLELRNKYDHCANKDFQLIFPAFYTLHALLQFISPLEVLQLGHWMLCGIDATELTNQGSEMTTPLSAGLSIIGGAFELLSTYLQQPLEKRIPYDFFWDMDENTFDTGLIEETYLKLCKLACNSDNLKLDIADSCLLKAANAMYGQRFMQNWDFHPLSMGMSRIIVRTPIEMVSHCVYRTNITKAKLLSLLVEMSPFHLQVFGKLFLRIEKGNVHVIEKISDYTLSDEDFIMLLPAAISFLDLAFVKFGKQHLKHFAIIPSFYSKILLDGFVQWKKFVSMHVFQEEYDKLFPTSVEELMGYLGRSVLGRAIHMLRYYFSLSRDSPNIAKRLKLFNSLLPNSAGQEELLDCVCQMDFESLNKSLNLINLVVAKISFCRMLLFPEENQIQHLPNDEGEGLTEISFKKASGKGNSSKMRFLNILVATWQLMVKKLPLVLLTPISTGGKHVDCIWLYKWLEDFILRSILELTKMMHDHLVQMGSIPFMEQLMRSSLLFRFEDPTTLRMLRNIMELLSDGKFSRIPYLQLLIAHSQFTPIIRSITKSSSSETGTIFKSLSSILRYLIFPKFDSNANNCGNNQEQDEIHVRQFETVKLLRTLLKFEVHWSTSHSENDIGINLGELQLLLLSSYGATLSQIDVEIYNLMHETGFLDEVGSETISDTDYVWGNAALKVKRERALEHETSNGNMADAIAFEERRRIQFRENLPVDPELCLLTALYFPYGRTANDGPLSFNELWTKNLKDIMKPHTCNAKSVRCYDPVFILRFSIHSLSAGYVEPVEFAGLGLLAVAFVGMSSPDLGTRKLGYEALGRFKNSLEKCQKKKDIMQLRLLLTWVQNGIEEPWQRIPSIIALFAAESSRILLDPMHDHKPALSKLLMHSSRVNMKQIPFFSDFFQCSSANFRMERLWMLRLAYGGLNLDDDAQIYIRNSILETLMSFYSSSLSDDESKELVLQTVNKSVKLPKMAYYLVENCGLLSWLSSILSIHNNVLLGDEKRVFLARWTVVVEVVSCIITLEIITEWLKGYALEQLMELSSHLYNLLVGGMKLIKENVHVVGPALNIILSTLMMSQEREDYQHHFYLPSDSLFQIHQAVDEKDIMRCSSKAELGLKAILMSLPPVDIFSMKHEKLSSFLYWATSTAQKSDSGKLFQSEGSYLDNMRIFEEPQFEEPMTLKLLRWLAGCVIRAKISRNLNHLNAPFTERCDLKNLKSLLEHLNEGSGERNQSSSACGDILAVNIYYLQQCLGSDCGFLPSVVSALCLLFLSGPDFMLDHKASVVSLCSRIRIPPEADPCWRWSFHPAWQDHSPEPTDLQKIDELHACQTLLVMISNAYGKKPFDFQALSHIDLENFGVFEWERSIIQTK